MDEACRAAKVWPDIVISGHAHNYQRYRRSLNIDGRTVEIPYLVVGTGGFSLSDVPSGIGINSIGPDSDRVLYVNALKEYGYVRITVDASSVATTFVRTQGNHRDVYETVQIDLKSGRESSILV